MGLPGFQVHIILSKVCVSQVRFCGISGGSAKKKESKEISLHSYIISHNVESGTIFWKSCSAINILFLQYSIHIQAPLNPKHIHNLFTGYTLKNINSPK